MTAVDHADDDEKEGCAGSGKVKRFRVPKMNPPAGDKSKLEL